MFLAVQIRLLTWNITMENVFIDPSGNRKKKQRTQHNQVMRHQRVREHYQENKSDGCVQKMLRNAHLAASKVEYRILYAVINKRQKRHNQDKWSHECSLSERRFFVNLCRCCCLGRPSKI